MNIGSKTHFRTTVTYSQMAADSIKKKGWHWKYSERHPDAELDVFVDNILDHRMWPQVQGHKFVPPGDPTTSPAYVKWRREGGRWVIDEMS